MIAQPRGTVSLLFTDIEGSTRLLEGLGRERYAQVLEQHRALLRAAIERHGGYEVDCEGDSFFVSFESATDAVAAASSGQESLALAEWPADRGPQVRMGIHTGEPMVAPPKYVGLDVHKAARIMAAGHGGQVVISQSTRDLLDPSILVKDLGEHRLKDLSGPQRLYQLGERSFPPLKTMHRTNLPVPATPFLGRGEEVGEVAALLRNGARLVTLTGPGGTGKTRLGLQAVGEVADGFPDGVWWIPLAPLRDPGLVLAEVAQALDVGDQPGRDLGDTLAEVLGGKRLLLLLDNAEHLLPDVAGTVARLRDADGPKVVVTSRERLQLAGEQVYPVPPLAPLDGVELFADRARALTPGFHSTAAVGELCERLDNLPLAIELAAARSSGLSPEQILARLSQRLDLLKAGRDADPRQQTLRSTIEWSYELLDSRERALFVRLAVFTGGWTLDAAEEVCDAEIDTLVSLVDKSLVRRTGERYWLLETIREYAAERFDEGSLDAEGRRGRHARYYEWLALEGRDGLRTSAQHSWIERFEAEQPNFRDAIEWSLGSGQADRALRTATALYSRWGAPLPSQGRVWLEQALATGAGSELERGWASYVLGRLTFFAGDLRQAVRPLQDGVDLARRAADDDVLSISLGFLGWLRAELGEYEEASVIAVQSLEHAQDARGWLRAEVLTAVAATADTRGDLRKSVALLEEALAIWRGAGDELGASDVLNNLGWCALLGESYDDARGYLEESLTLARRLGDGFRVTLALSNLALLALCECRYEEALPLLTENLRLCNNRGDRRIASEMILGLAGAHAGLGNGALAIRLAAAEAELRVAMGYVYSAVMEERLKQPLFAVEQELGAARVAELSEQGRRLTPEDVLAELSPPQPP